MARIHFRIVVYIATLVLHLGNLVYIDSIKKNALTPEAVKHAEQFQGLKYRFFTTWTFGLQMGYAILSLCCDLVWLKNSKKKDYEFPEVVNDLRNIMYSGLVWPTTLIVVSIFWTVYLYDRSLIFPVYLDEILPPVSNHIMHTAILPISVLELVLRPRTEPEIHARNVMQLTTHMLFYLSVMYFTYMERGIWLYPIYEKLYGTIYYHVSIVIIGILCYFYYYIQWPITKMIHGTKDKNNKKVTSSTSAKVQSKKNR